MADYYGAPAGISGGGGGGGGGDFEAPAPTLQAPDPNERHVAYASGYHRSAPSQHEHHQPQQHPHHQHQHQHQHQHPGGAATAVGAHRPPPQPTGYLPQQHRVPDGGGGDGRYGFGVGPSAFDEDQRPSPSVARTFEEDNRAPVPAPGPPRVQPPPQYRHHPRTQVQPPESEGGGMGDEGGGRHGFGVLGAAAAVSPMPFREEATAVRRRREHHIGNVGDEGGTVEGGGGETGNTGIQPSPLRQPLPSLPQRSQQHQQQPQPQPQQMEQSPQPLQLTQNQQPAQSPPQPQQPPHKPDPEVFPSSFRRKCSARLTELHRLVEESDRACRRAKEAADEVKSRLEEAQRELEGREKELKEAEEEHKLRVERAKEAELEEPCQWNAMFAELKRYKEEHGHCLVPHRTPNNPDMARLGRWVANQRVFFKMHNDGKTGHIKPHRIEALDSIGFVWSKYDMIWEQRYKELCAFKEKFGHCNVPSRFPDNPKLPKWLEVQRKNYRDFMGGRPNNLSAERKQKLDDLGFVWKVTARRVGRKISICRPKKPLRPSAADRNGDWEKSYTELAMYRAEYGDTRVNRGKIKGQSRLRNFVAWQRKQYKKFLRGEKSQLTPERVLRLEDLGFEWTVNSRRDPDSYVGKDVILPDETYDNTGEANVSANENNAKDRVNEFASTRPKGEDIATAAAIAGLDTYGTMGRTTAEFENPPMKEEDAAENVAGFDAYGTKGGRTGDMGMNDGYSANMAQVPEIRAAAAMAVHPAGPLVGNAPQDGVGENINGNGGQAVRTDDLDITAPHDMPAQGGGETADSTLPTAHPGTYENYQYYQTSNYQY